MSIFLLPTVSQNSTVLSSYLGRSPWKYLLSDYKGTIMLLSNLKYLPSCILQTKTGGKNTRGLTLLGSPNIVSACEQTHMHCLIGKNQLYKQLHISLQVVYSKLQHHGPALKVMKHCRTITSDYSSTFRNMLVPVIFCTLSILLNFFLHTDISLRWKSVIGRVNERQQSDCTLSEESSKS